MMKRSIYSSVSRPRRNTAKTVAIILGIVIALLLAFIIWCVIAFSSGNSAFTSQAEDISALKVQLEQKEQEITSLKEQIIQLEEQKRQLESAVPTPPADTATPTPSATPTNTPARTQTPARTATPTPTPPVVTQTPTPPVQSPDMRDGTEQVQ